MTQASRKPRSGGANWTCRVKTGDEQQLSGSGNYKVEQEKNKKRKNMGLCWRRLWVRVMRYAPGGLWVLGERETRDRATIDLFRPSSHREISPDPACSLTESSYAGIPADCVTVQCRFA